MAGRRTINRTAAKSPAGADLFAFAERRARAVDEITPSPLDDHFAKLMVRLNGAPNAPLAHAARMVSAWRAAGHTCLPLLSQESVDERYLEELQTARVVGKPGEWKPLILDAAGRLYLQRYWDYEQQLAGAINERIQRVPSTDEKGELNHHLDSFFSAKATDQRKAAATALTRNFCVITGGPGTGKTRTAACIVALLHMQSGSEKPLRVALAAPTGKAAARVTESMRKALEQLPLSPNLDAEAFEEAETLHRLLGIVPDRSLPRHHSDNPLPADVVIVDEASMVDLSLMTRLFAAMRPDARVILLGDKDQLASVEAGRVLGDLCAGCGTKESASPLADHIVHLRQNFRFESGGSIHLLSECIREGDAAQAFALLCSDERSDIGFVSLPKPDMLPRSLKERIVENYRPMLTARTPAEAIAAFDRFRLLCATRRGPYGVEQLNAIAERLLSDARLIAPTIRNYRGRPVLIVENDYNLQLFNGDIGLILVDPEEPSQLRAFFAGPNGTLRKIAPTRLPKHETAWAMTVHKTQGSEFDRVLLLIPDRESPLLTRELVYTGVTRARSSVEIWGDEAVLRTSIERKTDRSSGLKDALWKPL
ncbi:exodeoxyribonuclease V subunit alpha [Verrucomicrobiota bacterium sgz303538]